MRVVVLEMIVPCVQFGCGLHVNMMSSWVQSEFAMCLVLGAVLGPLMIVLRVCFGLCCVGFNR